MQQTVKLAEIDQSLSVFRLIRPEQITSMQVSLKKRGQLQPVSSHLSTIDTFFNLYLLVKIVSSLKLILNSLPILQRICSTAV